MALGGIHCNSSSSGGILYTAYLPRQRRLFFHCVAVQHWVEDQQERSDTSHEAVSVQLPQEGV